MKKITILLVFLTMLTVVGAKNIRTINNPSFTVSSTYTFQIEKVDINKESTVLHCVSYNHPGWWFKIASSSYLLVDGKKIKVNSAEGIKMDTNITVDSTRQCRYSLIFPAISAKTNSIDFLEGDFDGAFQVFGINLKNKKLLYDSKAIPEMVRKAAMHPSDDNKLLPMPKWENGSATVKGKLVGYNPHMRSKIEIFPECPFDLNNASIKPKISDDGSFSAVVPLYVSHQAVYIQIGDNSVSIILENGKECDLYVDLVKSSHYITDRIKAVDSYRDENECVFIYFSGAMSDVNNQITKPDVCDLKSFSRNMPKPERDNLTSEEYRDVIFKCMEKNLSTLDSLHLITSARQYMTSLIKSNTAINILYPSWSYIKINPNDRMAHRSNDVMKSISKLDLNNMMLAYTGKFSTLSNYLDCAIGLDTVAVKTFNLSSKKMAENGSTFEQINEYQRKYRKEYIASILGTSSGPVFDVIEGQYFSNILDSYSPFNDKQLVELNSMGNDVIKNYFLKKNNELKVLLEKRKNNKNYIIHTEKYNSGEDFLAQIGKAYEGKVVMIDLWGTWCGACRSSIKYFEPYKSELNKKGVVFVYVTDDKSPEGAWHNMCSGISGEHYRLSSKQTHEIFEKFKFFGWPSYIIKDKTGKYIFSQTGAIFENSIVDKLENALKI